MECILDFFKVIKKDILGIVDYKSCSRRYEYFYWYLFVVFISIIIGLIVGFIMEFISVLGEVILSLFLFFVFLVSLPLGIRRLHDIGKNHWLILIGLIPIFGPIILLVLFCKDSVKKYKKRSPEYIIEEKIPLIKN